MKFILLSVIFTSTQFVSRAVAVEVVTLAVLAAVPLLRVVSLLALTCAAHTVSVVAADVRTVVFTAGAVHVLCGYVVAAAFALPAHTSFITPETKGKVVILKHCLTLKQKSE